MNNTINLAQKTRNVDMQLDYYQMNVTSEPQQLWSNDVTNPTLQNVFHAMSASIGIIIVQDLTRQGPHIQLHNTMIMSCNSNYILLNT